MTLRASRRGVPGILALGALATGLAGPAMAAEPTYGSGGSLASTAGYVDPGTGRRLDLSIGKSVVIDLPRDAKEVFVANPGVANAVVRSTRKIFLIGVANGATSVFVMDAEGRQITALEVSVGRDLNILRQTIRTAIPNARIEVRAAGDSILLTGSVGGAGDAQQAVDIAKAFVGQSSSTSSPGSGATAAGATASQTSTGTVINAITIAGRDQVMLKVTVVEMARTAVKQLGVNVGGNWNVLQAAADGVMSFTNPGSTLVGVGTGVLGSLSGDGANIRGQAAIGQNATVGGTLTALERAGVSRILAEPTLVAISGESASFLAGGQIPLTVQTACAVGQFCPATIVYKDYGVSLNFTPIVLSEGRISLRVATEVSEIDRENQTRDGTPGFRTRKSTTTVELPSGATMVTAGLISSQSNQTISGVPGMINLPILGALFRSRDFQRRDSELMIMVTPYIAKPMEAAQAVRPDDGFVDADDAQTIFMGRLNKLYGVAGPKPGKAPSGRFGFITD